MAFPAVFRFRRRPQEAAAQEAHSREAQAREA
jgi:hypothetical protein